MPGNAFSMPGPACAANTPLRLPRLMRDVAVRDADADALLPAQDGADVERGAGLDQRIARIAGEELRAFALEDFGDDVRRHSWCFLPWLAAI